MRIKNKILEPIVSKYPITVFVGLVFFLPKPDFAFSYQLTFLALSFYMSYYLYQNKTVKNSLMKELKHNSVYKSLLILFVYNVVSNLIQHRINIGSLVNSMKPLFFILIYSFSLTISDKKNIIEIRNDTILAITIFIFFQFIVSILQVFDVKLLSKIYTDYKTFPYWHILRVGGTVNNPNTLGWFISQFVALYLVLEHNTIKKTIMIVINLIFILLTGSRTMLLLYPISILLILFLRNISLKKQNKFKGFFKFLLLFLGLMTIILFILYLFKDTFPYMSQIFNVFSGGLSSVNSFNMRLTLWDKTLSEILTSNKNIFFGISKSSFPSVDNDILYTISRYGIFGLILQCYLIVSIIKNSYKSSKMSYITISYLIMLLVLGLIAESTASWLYFMFIFLYLGMFNSKKRNCRGKILYVTQTPLEFNSSATIANMGYITGLAKTGYSIDLLTEEVKVDNIHYDASDLSVFTFINEDFRFKQSFIYEVFRNKKSKQVITENNSKNNSKRNQNNLLNYIKNILKNTLRSTIKKMQVFESQKINISNVNDLDVLIHDYEFVISCSDPKSSHLIVKELVKRQGKANNWIQIWGDPMYLDITRSKNFIVDCLQKSKEESLISISDRQIYVSPLTYNEQKKLYKKYEDTMRFIHQSRFPDINIYDEKESLYDFGYFGAYPSSIRNIQPLYEVLSDLNSNSLICGASDLKLKPINKLEIKGFQSLENVQTLESSTKVLIALCNNNGTQIPAKIYYYTRFVNKPIVVIVDGEFKEDLKTYFNKFERFFVAENDMKDIEAKLRSALEFKGSYEESNKNFSSLRVAQKIVK